ncbi:MULTISPECIES: SDR family oxidoreductase [Inquilinus]|jgi:NAD(P)-dependent dehydrogenase (short-subunit alcohol dehydrogenase family)|uniref:NAD(P)-dependent dehydrogenase (Short-subunit alcohol dehydrogenase family) n=1 Tax=Inquilinus ginsengisoli TaxID=363840 RepID=A0ABU1JLF4_9PROT|nr:SDR family oxidoreductase [Inquilinus ginsengisoli]MDR6289441.1 NAD(P)-dependent dehydrogenase (short-subunit alcohol dehydrogenase family) [Inquilinus ginsengisoli]
MDGRDFAGRRVLVTGAGKGIGRATAVMLHRRGAEVIAATRSAEDLKELAAEIGCRTIAVDLGDPEATRRAAIAALPVDALVNCAGTTTLESFLDTSVDSFDAIMAVNARAPMIVAQEVARDMIRRGRPGAIVNVSSVSSAIGLPDHTAYCASKGALDAITRVMAVELGPHGIRTNSVNPVVTLTPMAVKAWSDPAKSGPMLGRIPLGRFAQPDDVAEVILYLLGDAAAMMNGAIVPVDGGFLAT